MPGKESVRLFIDPHRVNGHATLPFPIPGEGKMSNGNTPADASVVGAAVSVPIKALRPADSPRFVGLDIGHAQALAESDAELPPILVRRATMRVVDGMHRLTAAEMRGQENISVLFFDGDQDEAFLLAVESNVRHGLPLTIAERRAAASRILRSHPERSDRSIAAIAGIAAKTVAGIRNATDDAPQVNARIGRDGRIRPLNPVEGRRLAGELFVDQPDASLRKIAREAGISVGTARDVRERIRRGDDPTLPPKQPQAFGIDGAATARPAPPRPRRPVDIVDIESTLEHLYRDPSLRYSNTGRSLLRWLRQRATNNSDWEEIVAQIPPHCAIVVAQIARGSALAWSDFAEALDERVRDCA
jgi:ParB-like chromosome segregation protein Spo0J